jgi:hypothetical protein
MQFRATVELGGKTATGIAVPDDVVEALGGGKRPPVVVTVNGFRYRTTVGSRGGRSLVPLSGERRAAAGVEAGDEVDVEIELDTEERTVDVPADFAAALDAHPAARRAFDAMSFSHQQRWVLSIEGAKAADTRQRRIDKAITDIGG